MKNAFFLILLSCNVCFGQSKSFESAGKWKLYDVAGHNLFKYSTDTLKHFSYYSLHDDSMHTFLQGIKELRTDDPPVWMGGPHVVTYELDGEIYKLDISHYGGFFFDERTRKYYQLSEDKRDDWLTYIRDCFIAVHADKLIV